MGKKNKQNDVDTSSTNGKAERIKQKKLKKVMKRNKQKSKSFANMEVKRVDGDSHSIANNKIKITPVTNDSKTIKRKKSKKQKKRNLEMTEDEIETKIDIKEEIKTENENKESAQRIGNANEINDKNKPIKRNARIIVRNMSFKATDASLNDHFSKFGEILEVKILRKPGGKLVGCAFVQFKNVPMAKKAILECNMKSFLGRPISVDWAVPKDKYMRHIVGKESSDNVKTEIKTENEESDHPHLSANDTKIKNEPNSDDETKDSNGEKSSGSESSSDEEDEGNDNEDENLERKHTIKHVKEEDFPGKKKSNDAEDGCTIFMTNVPFSMDKEQLSEFAKKIGPIKYAVICMDQLTEHSRGTAFIKFESADKATEFINLSPDELTVDGQTIHPKPALLREHLGIGKTSKQPKDNRNLYLVKEGVVIAGTKAAVGVSASDMSKRLSLEQSKTQMLRNLNRFVSRYRLVVQNLPPNYDDAKLRQMCTKSVPGRPTITEARVMRDLRSPVGTDGKHPSKGYGFVMFTRHEDALVLLRKLNNNPDIFDKNNRPIVSFSIEDRAVLNARKKRLEKSLIKNPLSKKYQKPTEENPVRERVENQNRKKNKIKDFNAKNPRKGIKRTLQEEPQTSEQQQPKKKKKFNKKPKNPELHGASEASKTPFKPKHANNFEVYSGLTSKPGSQHKMRSNFKLRKQAEMHKQTVKAEKLKQKKSGKNPLFKKEKIKQPKQKQDTNKSKKSSRMSSVQRRDTNFSDLVNKYKSKLVSNRGDKIKSKWYES